MLDFDEELKKFQPIIEVNELEDEIKNTNLSDVLDLIMNDKDKKNIMRKM